MDISYNSAHHVQVGRLVLLRDLSQTEFNGREGIVLGFYPDKTRFAVRLSGDVTPKLFKGKNLELDLNGWEMKHNDIRKRLDRCKGLKEIFAMKNEIEEKFAFNEADVFIRYLWMRHAQTSVGQLDRNIAEELLQYCDELLKESKFSSDVLIQMYRANFLDILGEKEKCIEVLKACVDEHYGRLPEIAHMLIVKLLNSARSVENYKICSDLIEKCDTLICNGNYSPDSNVEQYLETKFDYYCRDLFQCQGRAFFDCMDANLR